MPNTNWEKVKPHFSFDIISFSDLIFSTIIFVDSERKYQVFYRERVAF